MTAHYHLKSDLFALVMKDTNDRFFEDELKRLVEPLMDPVEVDVDEIIEGALYKDIESHVTKVFDDEEREALMSHLGSQLRKYDPDHLETLIELLVYALAKANTTSSQYDIDEELQPLFENWRKR